MFLCKSENVLVCNHKAFTAFFVIPENLALTSLKQQLSKTEYIRPFENTVRSALLHICYLLPHFIIVKLFIFVNTQKRLLD